jgi:hypothetical protein
MIKIKGIYRMGIRNHHMVMITGIFHHISIITVTMTKAIGVHPMAMNNQCKTMNTEIIHRTVMITEITCRSLMIIATME